MTTTHITPAVVRLTADPGHLLLHPVHAPCGCAAAVCPADATAQWAEASLQDAPATPLYTHAQYAEAVQALVAARYSLADEIALLRQRDTKPTEFAAYNAYTEQCKADAHAQLIAPAATHEHQ